MSQNQDFLCPYCNRHSIIEVTDISSDGNITRRNLGALEEIRRGKIHLIRKTYPSAVEQECLLAGGSHVLRVLSVVCSNPKCARLFLEVSTNLPSDFFSKYHREQSGYLRQSPQQREHKWRLLPNTEAKPFPDYIPPQIIKDYNEACLIKDLSPNASATMARRCLQGMVRDFYGVRKPSLREELEAIHDRVTPPVWQAIDQIRELGNIGAHMEKDVNLIVDVESDEADKLIWLIEFLLEKWYVDKHETDKRLEEMRGLKEKKKPKPNKEGVKRTK